MLISIIYLSLYCCMLTGIHRSMERVTSDFRRSCLASSSSVFIVAINTYNTLHKPKQDRTSVVYVGVWKSRIASWYFGNGSIVALGMRNPAKSIWDGTLCELYLSGLRTTPALPTRMG